MTPALVWRGYVAIMSTRAGNESLQSFHSSRRRPLPPTWGLSLLQAPTISTLKNLLRHYNGHGINPQTHSKQIWNWEPIAKILNLWAIWLPMILKAVLWFRLWCLRQHHKSQFHVCITLACVMFGRFLRMCGCAPAQGHFDPNSCQE